MAHSIHEAIEFRKNKNPEAALEILKTLQSEDPKNPDVLYQIAWTFDSMGKEVEAAPYYEAALSHGLKEDRYGAFVGLGSTYRCLGEYEKSLKTFDQALTEFPEDRALKVFRALTCYNLGRAEDAVSCLLVQLLDTTKDPAIHMYERALRFYSDKLNQTWKD